MIVSLPAMILATLVFFFVKDPKRGSMEVQHHEIIQSHQKRIATSSTPLHYNNRVQRIKLSVCKYYSDVKALFRIPSFVLLLLQGAVGCIPWGIGMSYCLFKDRLQS